MRGLHFFNQIVLLAILAKIELQKSLAKQNKFILWKARKLKKVINKKMRKQRILLFQELKVPTQIILAKKIIK